MDRPFAHGIARPTLILSLCLLLLAGWATPVNAQEIFAVEIAGDNSRQSTTGDCVSFTVVIRNTGSSPIPQQHTIVVNVGAPPSGWRVEPSGESEVMLPAGGQTQFPLSLCPTESATAGRVATVEVTARVADDLRDPPASASRTFSAEFEEEGLFGFDLPDAALYVALLAILALLGVVLMTRRRGTAGIAVSCPEPAKEVSPDRGTSFPIRVRNEGRARDVVTLTTSPVPQGWDTFLPLVDIPLEPREEQTVWLSVKSPADAQTGDRVVVKVLARSASGGGEHAEIDTLTTVRAPEGAHQTPWGGAPSPAGGPPDEDERPEEGEQSVYGREDEDPEDRPVAVKRRKASS